MFGISLCVYLIIIVLNTICKAQNREYYTCDKPEENRSNLTNCIANTLEFPASIAICDYCGERTILTCKNGFKWHRYHIQNCNPKIEPNSQRCTGVYNTELYICPDLEKDKEYLVGTRIVCSCVSNCRKYVFQCKITPTRHDVAWSPVQGFQPCSNDTFALQNGPLRITYYPNVSQYVYTCNSSYEINNSEKNVLVCTNGRLNSSAPFCKPKGLVVPSPRPCKINKELLNCLGNEKTIEPGAIIACTCKKNCRNLTLTCDGDDGRLKFEKSFARKLCTENIYYILKDKHININISNGHHVFMCEEGYQLKGKSIIDCSNGILQDKAPICVINVPTPEAMLPTTEISTIINNEDDNTSTNYYIIFYPVTGILVIISISLFVYLIYTRGKRREIENNVLKVVEPEAHYDYPVFNAVNANEEPNYDYPVFPIHSDQNNHEQPTYEYVTMNELYVSSR